MGEDGGRSRDGDGDGKVKISFGGLKKPTGSTRGQPSGPASSSVLSNSAFGAQDDFDDVRSTSGKARLGPGVAPSSRASQQRQSQALSLDASVFDYDGVYDSMKTGEREAEAAREREKQRRDPKYIAASLASSEQRRLDRQRAEARKIQREREQEGDTYADTEAFVTDAYKRQMEQTRQDEERERKEEQEQARRKAARNGSGGVGVAGFLRDYMSQQDRQHQAAVEASTRSNIVGRQGAEQDEQSSEQRAASRVQEALSKGFDVRLNDDNEVVDERSLLSAGLNTFASKRRKTDAVGVDGADGSSRHDQHTRGRREDVNRTREDHRNAQRQRQSNLIEEQLLAVHRQREEQQTSGMQAQKEALTSQRRNGQDRVEQARQRALERRRQREMERSDGS